MGIFQINKIKNEISDIYTGKIDLEDCKGRDEEYQKNVFLTRALSAFTVQKLCSGDIDEIAKCVCDGYEDNGIDCIYYDEEDKGLYLVQSKWSNEGNSSPALGDIDKFIKGIRDLISCRFSNFNEKVQKRSSELERILYKTKSLKVYLILTHTATQTSTHISKRFKEFLLELNDTSDSFSFTNIDQKMIFSYIQGEIIDRVDIEEVVLTEWGKKPSPRKAYYGSIDGLQIAKWFDIYGKKLFNKNIRMIIPDSEINSEIKETIISDPESFWYYNNGITLIAGNVIKRPINGDERNFAIFDCEDVSIINGAQTVGTIGRYALEYKDDEEKTKPLKDIKIQIRLICTNENDDLSTFVDNVTKANNRQNKVENRDFVSLEVNQKRLSAELRVVGINYNIIRSDDNIIDEYSFDVSESTRALSNLLDINASTLVHREPSKIWSDINNKRYRQLFNPGIKGLYLWNAVKIQRLIDKKLEELKGGLKGDKKALLTYGEDALSCIIFSKVRNSIQKEILMDNKEFEDFNIDNIIEYSINTLQSEVLRINKGIPTIFKNYKHCEEIYEKVINAEEFKEF